jgi:hypothetical protein
MLECNRRFGTLTENAGEIVSGAKSDGLEQEKRF